MAANITDDIPSNSILQDAFKLNVVDEKGTSVPFENVLNTNGKTIVIFTRHFFCGNCQDYVTKLSQVNKDTLDALNIKIVVIGCGESEAIPFYAGVTGFNDKIYADPTRALYRTLGMVERLGGAPRGQQRKSYLSVGPTMNLFRSIWRELKNASLIGKGGNISQIGGDFIFDSEKHCIWTSRMKHTEDHAEIPDLLKAAGVTASAAEVE